MESMFLLIPLVVVFALVAVLVFVWAVNNGQYDDLDREAEQVLFEDDLTHTERSRGACETPPSLRDTSPKIRGGLNNHD